ncbi:hypothetical protein HY375_00340 [Candidatus Berkelbacteria bacterium]|nr:hypothetical protein [Candidatus Berkelbacteria bacterium]
MYINIEALSEVIPLLLSRSPREFGMVPGSREILAKAWLSGEYTEQMILRPFARTMLDVLARGIDIEIDGHKVYEGQDFSWVSLDTYAEALPEWQLVPHFSWTEEYEDYKEFPSELREQVTEALLCGDVVQWQGKSFVVTTVQSKSHKVLTVVPACFIDLTDWPQEEE